MIVRLRQLARWRPLRWVFRPIAVVAFGAVFLVHTLLLILFAGFCDHNCANHLQLLFGDKEVIAPVGEFIIVRQDGAYAAVSWYYEHDEYWEHWDDNGYFCRAGVQPRRMPTGLWAATTNAVNHTVYLPQDLSPEDRAACRAAVVDWWREELAAEWNQPLSEADHRWLRLLESGDGVTHNRLWTGYLHNAFAIAMLAMTGVALLVTLWQWGARLVGPRPAPG